MSDTNRVKLSYVKQNGLGDIPANPELKEIRLTGAPDLAFSPQTTTSEELRADRQISDLPLVGAQAGGSTPVELSFATYDELLEVALFNYWIWKATRLAKEGEITDVAVGQYNVTDVNQAWAEGMLVRATGFAETSNNGKFVAETGSSATVLVYSSAVLEATVPEEAKLKQIGFQGITGDIQAVSDGLSSTSLDFTTMGLNVGDRIKIGGTATSERFDTEENNDWVRITDIAAAKLTCDLLPSGWAADAGTGKTITVFVGDTLRNGVDQQFVFLEEQFTDHDPITYQYFQDMDINVMELSFPSQSIVTGNITYQGTDADMTETEVTGATRLPATLTGVMNSSSNVGRIAEGGEVIQGKNFVLEASININNNLRYQNAVGSIGAIGIGAGEISVTGSLNTYFDDKTIAEKVINNTESSFDIRVEKDNQAYYFDLPRMKYSDGAPTVPGKNQDVTLEAEYQAILSPDFGYTIQVQRFEEYED